MSTAEQEACSACSESQCPFDVSGIALQETLKDIRLECLIRYWGGATDLHGRAAPLCYHVKWVSLLRIICLARGLANVRDVCYLVVRLLPGA
jgi:hypothetical protein